MRRLDAGTGREVKKAPAEASRRLLLLSDGLLNGGVIDPQAVRQVVVSGLQQDSIRTSCLGFGVNYNEDLMTTMAQVSGGQFYDADAPERLPAIFESELEGLQKLTVQNLRVRVRRLDFCETISPLGHYPAVERPEGWTEFFVGDLVTGESRVVCFQLGVPLPGWMAGRVVELGENVFWKWKCLRRNHGGGNRFPDGFQVVRIQATQNPEEVRQRAEVIPWVALQRAAQVMDEITKLMDFGKLPEAVGALIKPSLP